MGKDNLCAFTKLNLNWIITNIHTARLTYGSAETIMITVDQCHFSIQQESGGGWWSDCPGRCWV